MNISTKYKPGDVVYFARNSKIWKREIKELAVSVTVKGAYKESYYLSETWAGPEELFLEKESALAYIFDKIRSECE